MGPTSGSEVIAVPNTLARAMSRRLSPDAVPAYVWFIAPALTVYVVFFAYPTAWAFWLATYDWSGIGRIEPFVGFGNFEKILTMPHFYRAASHNLFVFFAIFALVNTVALGLALML